MFRTPTVLTIALILVVGCSDSQKPTQGQRSRVATDIPMTVGVVEDARLAEVVQRELSARLDFPVSVEPLTNEELLAGNRLTHDVLFYSPEILGELVAREWIDPLPTPVLESPEIEPSDIAPRLYQQQIRWGESIYALPLGTQVLTLMVRKDVLDTLEIEVPQTWEDYLAAIEKIKSSQILGSGDGQPVAATLEPFDEKFLPDLWLSHCSSYVSRSGSFSSYFNFETGEAETDQAGFIRGTNEMAQVYQSIPESLRELTPREVADQFLQGKSVMALSWLSSENDPPETISGEIDFAPVPGSQTRYQVSDQAWQARNESREPITVPVLLGEGKVASISATSGRTLQAGEIATLLTSAEMAPLISPSSSSTGIFRNSSLPQVANWLPKSLPNPVVRRYAQTTMQQLQAPVALSTLRIPNRQEYWSIARELFPQMLKNPEIDARITLEELTVKWNDISKEHGIDDHKQYYRQSIGISD